ncbi:MAG: helix-turn-helix domain-containing protein [Bryobacteraceae bacterium]
MKRHRSTDPLITAVRKLREGLGDTQQEFADRLGLAIATVVRYEHNRTPRGKALARLEQAATASGFDQCAALFRNALVDEFGAPPPSPKTRTIQCRSDDEMALVDALLYVVRLQGAPAYAKAARAVRRALRPVLEDRRRTAETDEALEAQRNAIVRLLEKGRTVKEVAEIFRTTAVTIAEAFFRNGSPTLVQERMREVVAVLLKEGWSISRMVGEFGHGDAEAFLACANDLGDYGAVREYEDDEAAKGSGSA